MKLFQNSVRALVIIGSLGGFFSGWALIAHAGKPASANTDTQPEIVAPAPLPTLAPLNFSNSAPSGGLQQLQPLPQMPQTSQLPRVRLRSRGS